MMKKKYYLALYNIDNIRYCTNIYTDYIIYYKILFSNKC